MHAKCVSGEEMKRGGKEQHSKIGPVNNGEDVATNAVAGGRGDETGKIARCHGKRRVRKSGRAAASAHTQREMEPQMGSCYYVSENCRYPKSKSSFTFLKQI
jgi:hypothetical protein